MNFRTTYILLAVVVLALAGLGGYLMFSKDEDKQSPNVEGYLLKNLRAANVKPDDVITVEVERPGQTPEKVAFAREGKTWKMVAPAAARADASAVDSLVSGVLNAKVEKSADISSLGAHGLDNPAVKVTLKTQTLSETVSLGNVTVGGDRALVYVTTSGQPDRPQAVRRGDFAALFRTDAPKTATNAGQLVKGVTDFRPLKILGEGLFDPANQVQSMQVRLDKDGIALFRTPPDNVWKFRVPPDYGEAAVEADTPSFGGPKEGTGINTVRELLNTINAIQPASRKEIVENPADLSQYGLDPTKNAPMQIDLSRDDGVKETAYVSGPIKKEDGEKYYARHEADGVVYEVPADPVKKVQAAVRNKQLLRDRTVLRVQMQRVDAIDLTANGETFELRRVGLSWKVYGPDGKDRPAKASAITELLTRLTARQLATGFPTAGIPEDKMGFAKPAVELKVWENGIVREEKPDPNAKPKVNPNPTARVVFGHKDVGDVVYTRRVVGDTKVDFLVPQDAYNLAARGRLDYIDASLKPYGADSVLKLSFTHGKDAYELERADDGKPVAQAAWKINSPPSLQGRTADPAKIADLLNTLSFMRPTKVAADKPTDEILNRLRVNPADPRLKVTVNIKGQGEQVLLFGEDVGAEKRSVYLKPADGDLVFEVDRGAFDLFQKADVQDTVVHRLDKTKIQAVKITGWQEVLGTPTTIELERKEGKWALKSGGMYELDPVKVDALLNDLATPRADAFVVLKEGPKPEHNLDVAKSALAIELTMEGMKDPVKVVISAPNKDGKVFATSSLSAGDVFTMPDKFATLRSKPAALKKD
ncbi:MAG TPA: DUF4340 domain-containing protein [Gemmataceae bacterium]|nr:DUF4340 domain-containing protein [Gemmataceae bacterium]